MLDKNKIILIWYEIKGGLLYVGKKDTSLKLYKDFVYKNLKDLNKMECYKPRSNIELIIKNRSFSYPYDENLYKIYLNNIFAITLGMIDAKVNYYNDRINACVKANISTNVLLNEKEELLEYKKIVIKDIEHFISDGDIEIKKALRTMHSHITIEDLYEYMRTNKKDFNVEGELLNAYIYGYNKPLLNNYEDLFLYYKKVIYKFSKTKEKNDCCIQKVKSLNKNK